MRRGNVEYTSRAEENHVAQKIFDDAASMHQSAAIVRKSDNHSSEIIVTTSMGPNEKVTFRVTYEEFLQRNNSKYQLVTQAKLNQVF